jgi:hypothetical protein
MANGFHLLRADWIDPRNWRIGQSADSELFGDNKSFQRYYSKDVPFDYMNSYDRVYMENVY